MAVKTRIRNHPAFAKVEDIVLGSKFKIPDSYLVNGRYRFPDQYRTQHMADVITAVLDQLLYTDRLTGLPTLERAVHELNDIITVRRDIKERGDDPEPCAIVTCDLNNFGALNTSLGHIPTDGLIIAFADELRKATRHGLDSQTVDMVARYANRADNFILLMNGRDKEQARQSMQRITDMIAAKTFVFPQEHLKVTRLGTCFGCHQLSQEKGIHDKALRAINAADQDMFIIKNPQKEAFKAGNNPGYAPKIARVSEAELHAMLQQAGDNVVIVDTSKIISKDEPDSSLQVM